ncbi:MAG: hypothetical protein VR68_00200 [Peptococcaceae bacterium BRH_c4a]|nr:MAG: hypothetical protein VR68_00200 [Peptococcaceae bacterium BRH_c4a]
MTGDFLDYKIRKHFAAMDKLITELVIIRRYIDSAKMGLNYCREHVVRGFSSGELFLPEENDFITSQEKLLVRLQLLERKMKKRLRESSRELACICGQEHSLSDRQNPQVNGSGTEKAKQTLR